MTSTESPATAPSKWQQKKAAQRSWSPKLRLVISALILFHCSALFVAPWASPYPSSDLARWFESWMEPYLRVTFLKDHGYRFFAPNPPLASHLVRYELFDQEDQLIKEGKFPDLEEHWPRLLYHRHFMISESLFGITDLPPEPQPLENESQSDFNRRLASYQRGRLLADTYLESISSYLAKAHNAAKVKVYMIEHFVLSPEESLAGKSNMDDDLFRERLLGEYVNDEVKKP